MSGSSAPVALPLHLALLSILSFGGVPSVLPDIHNYVVAANGWLTAREFANCFAIAQALPGPNMILMMSLIGWKVGGLPTAIASALAIFGPPCALYYLAYSLWDRFRHAPWQQIARRGLVPVTIGLILGGGTVMARAADTNWQSGTVTMVAAALILWGRISPLWMLIAAGAVGALGLL
jgi:chromate transporter